MNEQPDDQEEQISEFSSAPRSPNKKNDLSQSMHVNSNTNQDFLISSQSSKKSKLGEYDMGRTEEEYQDQDRE